MELQSIAVVLTVVFSLATACRGSDAPAARIARTTTPVTVDGRLDESLWDHALSIDMGTEIEPGENIPAPIRTECLLAYDEKALYVAFRAFDPDPLQIRAHFTDRDACFRDDMVGVMLDTFNDGRRGFEFFVNPLGVQMDAARNEVGSDDDEDTNWDALWHAAGRLTADGYVAEMAIPFTSLRFPRGSGAMTWGVVPFRAYPRTDRHQLTSFANDRNRTCFICQADKVVGFEGVRPGRNIELTPTITAARTDVREESGSAFDNGRVEKDPGLSVSWSVSPNLALNGTINPDFSQVEADVAQLDVNRRFALFFPEKRPFFLEGSDFFSTPFRVVHTRAIADPDYGLKITGKQGRNAFGAFVAQDAVTNILIPGSQRSSFAQIGGRVWDGVARFRRDIGKSSTLGALVTVRDGEDGYSNLTAGVDGLLRVSKVDSIRFQLVQTQTEYPNELAEEEDQKTGRFGGLGGRVAYTRDSRNWSWWAGHVDKGRGFRTDLGFITQADARGPFAGLQRILRPQHKTWYTRMSFGFESDYTEDHDGQLVSEYAQATASWNGPYQAVFETGIGPTRERFEGRDHEFVSGWTFFNIRPTGDFTSSFETRFGGTVDYENGRQGEVLNLTPGITYDPGRHLRLQLDHTYERLSAEGGRVYTANLTQLKAIYQFDARMFMRTILQLDDLHRNVANFRNQVDARDRSLLTQLLFSYKLSAQTLFHFGYSDNRRREPSGGLHQTDRTLFLKLSYAWLP